MWWRNRRTSSTDCHFSARGDGSSADDRVAASGSCKWSSSLVVTSLWASARFGLDLFERTSLPISWTRRLRPGAGGEGGRIGGDARCVPWGWCVTGRWDKHRGCDINRLSVRCVMWRARRCNSFKPVEIALWGDFVGEDSSWSIRDFENSPWRRRLA